MDRVYFVVLCLSQKFFSHVDTEAPISVFKLCQGLMCLVEGRNLALVESDTLTTRHVHPPCLV